jgi:hypothetical protein
MAEYRIRATGQVVLENELRRWASETTGASWQQTTDEVLQILGVDVVFEGPQATSTSPYKFSMRQGVEQVNGKWYTKYVLGPIFTDYTDDQGVVVTAAQQEAAYRANIDANQAKAVRDQRTKLLQESDWTQVLDAPLDRTAWANYRQVLRDVPEQIGFPWNVQWPQKPE